ncbi:MAG: hypothetical protein HZB51_11920 [Chloroflexi bacterium]|nr:hypothetical protein [Chloroflexota bacterium]
MATSTKNVNVPMNGQMQSAGRFLWHFVQMVLAMMIGMMIYHLLTGKALAAYPVLNFAGMELSMIPPMIALMRYHRYSWQRTFEMTAATLIGPAVFIVCVQLGLHNYVPGLSQKLLFMLGDVTMYLGMLGIMLYRRAEYSTGHDAHQHGEFGGVPPTCKSILIRFRMARHSTSQR